MAGAALLAGCYLESTRPAFGPLPEASTFEVELAVPEATQRLAEALRNDSIPALEVHPRDGWLQTPWFHAASGARAEGAPVGEGVVRVRGWVEVGRPGHSDITLETVYHRVVDPSVPERQLDRIVGPTNPAAIRVKVVIDSLQHRYGEPPPPIAPAAGPAPAAPSDSFYLDSVPRPVRPGGDSLHRVDSLHHADSLRRADSIHRPDSLRRADSLPRDSVRPRTP